MTLRRLSWLTARPLLLASIAVAIGFGIRSVGDAPSTADATHQGWVQTVPGFILIGHKVTLPVKMQTCTVTSSLYCRLGAYDVTVSYDATKLSVVSWGGTSTGGNTSTTIKSTGAGWKKNQWAGSQVRIVGGTGNGQYRTVLSNLADTITLNSATPWTTVPGATSIFTVGGMTDGGFLGSTGRSLSCGAPEYETGKARSWCNTLGWSPPGPMGAGNIVALSVSADSKGLISLPVAAPPPPQNTPMVLNIDGLEIAADKLLGSRRVILCPDPITDGTVTAADLSSIAQAFFKRTGEPGYSILKDPIEDGLINAADLSATAGVFFLKCIQQ